MTAGSLPAALDKPRLLLAGIGAAGVALVGGGVYLAQTMNLAACPLCILQRMLYLLLGLEAALICALPVLHKSQRVLSAAAWIVAVTTAAGALAAGYQTWLQRFAKGVSCTADQPWWEQLVNWAGAQWPLLFEATGLCSEAGWKFLGMSIAEWSLLIFLAMTAIAVRAATRTAN